MNLLAVLPAPLITLAVALLKFVNLPDTLAPWVALSLAVATTIIIRLTGITEDNLTLVVVFLIHWLGSMGTWEGIKNLFIRGQNDTSR